MSMLEEYKIGDPVDFSKIPRELAELIFDPEVMAEYDAFKRCAPHARVIDKVPEYGIVIIGR